MMPRLYPKPTKLGPLNVGPKYQYGFKSFPGDSNGQSRLRSVLPRPKPLVTVVMDYRWWLICGHI